MLSSKSIILLLLIAAAGQITKGEIETDQCDTASIVLEIGDNPILRELHKDENFHRCSAALSTGYLRVAKLYWNEIVCIEAANKKDTGGSSESTRLLPTLKHIIREYVTVVLVPGNSQSISNIRILLELVQHTNISGPQPLEFLLHEFKTFPELIYERDNLVFELGLEIKMKLGVNSPVFKALPRVVQTILSDKPIRVQNLASKQYLAFKEFDDGESKESLPYVSAVTVPSTSDSSTSWTLVSDLHHKAWEAEVASLRPTLPVYYAQLKSNAKCTKTNCTGLLAEAESKAHNVVSSGNRYYTFGLSLQSTEFVLLLKSEETVVIKRRNFDDYSLPMTLTDSVSGGLQFLPENFYRLHIATRLLTEFFHLDYDLEFLKRTEEERMNDLDRNQWIISPA